jgi:hypothetical protein
MARRRVRKILYVVKIIHVETQTQIEVFCDSAQYGGIEPEVFEVDGVGIGIRRQRSETVGILREYLETPVGNDIILISLRPDVSLERHQDLAFLSKDGGQVDIGDIIIAPVSGVKGKTAGQIDSKAGQERIFRGGEEGGVDFTRDLFAAGVLPDTRMLQEDGTAYIDEVYLFLARKPMETGGRVGGYGSKWCGCVSGLLRSSREGYQE